MKTIISGDELNERLEHLRNEGKKVGFVPTMGALHKGHAALVNRARVENDVVVVSIFVNPTQFNNPDDLVFYPRTPESDTELLEKSGCDFLFAPSVDEMYPRGTGEQALPVELDGMDTILEGAFRPGHFKGVMQVVKKLFEKTGRCSAYFGEKDFQQLAIIRKMTEQLQLPVVIVACPTVREEDGLAMSSRNMRLSPTERKVAPKIYAALLYAKKSWQNNGSPEAIRNEVTALIKNEPLMRLEYFEIADRSSLHPVSPDQKTNAVACIAVYLGEVRLIDNILLG